MTVGPSVSCTSPHNILHSPWSQPLNDVKQPVPFHSPLQLDEMCNTCNMALHGSKHLLGQHPVPNSTDRVTQPHHQQRVLSGMVSDTYTGLAAARLSHRVTDLNIVISPTLRYSCASAELVSCNHSVDCSPSSSRLVTSSVTSAQRTRMMSLLKRTACGRNQRRAGKAVCLCAPQGRSQQDESVRDVPTTQHEDDAAEHREGAR